MTNYAALRPTAPALHSVIADFPGSGKSGSLNDPGICHVHSVGEETQVAAPTTIIEISRLFDVHASFDQTPAVTA